MSAITWSTGAPLEAQRFPPFLSTRPCVALSCYAGYHLGHSSARRGLDRRGSLLENLCASKGAPVLQAIAYIAPGARPKSKGAAQRFPRSRRIGPLYTTRACAGDPCAAAPALAPLRARAAEGSRRSLQEEGGTSSPGACAPATFTFALLYSVFFLRSSFFVILSYFLCIHYSVVVLRPSSLFLISPFFFRLSPFAFICSSVLSFRLSS